MLLSRILPEVARMHPNNLAMKSSKEALTYHELIDKVSKTANGFKALSIRPGDRVALLGHPSPLLSIAECAAVAIGAIPTAVFPGLAPAEIVQILQDSAPVAVVYDGFDPVHLSEILLSLNLSHCISCKAEHAQVSIEHFITHFPSLDQWHEADPDDVALIIYTGGTTGRSKGVMHSHRGIRSWSLLNPEKGGGHNPAKKALVPNQAHLTGQFVLWSTLFEGGCLIYADSYPLQAEEVAAVVEREQIRFLGTVGLLFRDLVTLIDKNSGRLPSLEGISCGGAPISEKTFRQARKVFPNANLTEVYSQTESGNFISFLSISQCFREGTLHRLLSVGTPANMALWGQKQFLVRIVDESGNDVEVGETGEIICQGDQLMLGYWNNPQETSRTLCNGWLHTGDLGKFDEDGYLYLVDRKKDVIIVNGANVYGSEVEEVLSKHPSIVEIAVIGIPLSDEGEEVTAVVKLSSCSELTLAEIRRFCRPYLASYKIPARLERIDSFPRTPVGKLDKQAIRAPYWAGKIRMIN